MSQETVQYEFLTRDSALELLESKAEWKRDIARNWLEQNKDTAGDVMLQRLREEAAKRKKKQMRIYWAFGIYGSVLAVAVLGWIVFGITTGRWPEFPWMLFQMFSYMGIFGSVGMASQFQKSATQVIAKFDDIRFVPDLIDALAYNDKNVTEVARKALTNLLLRLTAKDTSLLSSDHRKLLLRSVIDKRRPEFGKAILKAMEQVGDERDLPAVKKIAEGEAATVREKEIRQAARECLPYVEQRAEFNRVANTLLRASSSAPESELLRPAGSGSESESNSLLRSADSADSVPIHKSVQPEVSETVEIRSQS